MTEYLLQTRSGDKMSEPTYVAVRQGETRPLWSTESDSMTECYAAAIRQGLDPNEFRVVDTEDLDD